MWTQAAKGEFSCFGVTEVDTDSSAIVVKKFFLPEQTCTDSHTSPDRESMGALMTELVRAGYDVSDLRCWAHSHADLNCFWSEEDADSIEQMDNGDWLLSIVTNKAGHFRARLDQYAPWRITVDQIKVGFMASVERDETLEKELHEKVRSPKPTHWSMTWPQTAMDDYLGHNSQMIDATTDVIQELQLVGLDTDQADTLLEALGDSNNISTEEILGLIDDVLGDDAHLADPWSVMQVLADFGYVHDRA